MEPVINPWAFYLIDGASTLKWGAFIFGSIIALIFVAIGANIMIDAYEDDKSYNVGKKKVKIGFIIFVVSVVMFIIVPSSDTVMKMVIAKNVTYDAVDAAKDVVVQVYNDILALFQK